LAPFSHTLSLPSRCSRTIFQPLLEAPIHLHQLAEMRSPRSPLSVWLAFPLSAPQPRIQHPPPQRFGIHPNPVIFFQVLGSEIR
jgi:hypothetical protein